MAPLVENHNITDRRSARVTREKGLSQDRRSTIGPNSLFNLKGVNPHPESGSVAKDVMGKIQEGKATQAVKTLPTSLKERGYLGH
eukprot:1137091-Pelagomonas_calceolata.AAC.2